MGAQVVPLVVIVGPTASGKSALSLDLAEEFNGEIICADSRTIYRYMDIGTAKPTTDDRNRVRHHLVDIVEPNQAFTVADFKSNAEAAIYDISSRGKLPFLVGGSGLYVDSVIYDYQFRPTNPALRQSLEKLSIDELQAKIKESSLVIPENSSNKRYLIRTLEAGVSNPSNRSSIRENTLVIGLELAKEKLEQRINSRIKTMLDAGLIEETRWLGSKYGWNIEPMHAPAYAAFRGYITGEYDLKTAKTLFARDDLRLAKKQRTWFKRNNSIQWVNDPKNSVDIITTFLNNL